MPFIDVNYRPLKRLIPVFMVKSASDQSNTTHIMGHIEVMGYRPDLSVISSHTALIICI